MQNDLDSHFGLICRLGWCDLIVNTHFAVACYFFIKDVQHANENLQCS